MQKLKANVSLTTGGNRVDCEQIAMALRGMLSELETRTLKMLVSVLFCPHHSLADQDTCLNASKMP